MCHVTHAYMWHDPSISTRLNSAGRKDLQPLKNNTFPFEGHIFLFLRTYSHYKGHGVLQEGNFPLKRTHFPKIRHNSLTLFFQKHIFPLNRTNFPPNKTQLPYTSLLKGNLYLNKGHISLTQDTFPLHKSFKRTSFLWKGHLSLKHDKFPFI